MHTLNEGEVGRLFQASEDHRLHALWVLLATTGLRLGEALGLLWSDIDFASARLVVNRALQRQPGVGYAFVEPKTARSRRTVYLVAGTVTVVGPVDVPPAPSVATTREPASRMSFPLLV